MCICVCICVCMCMYVYVYVCMCICVCMCRCEYLPVTNPDKLPEDLLSEDVFIGYLDRVLVWVLYESKYVYVCIPVTNPDKLPEDLFFLGPAVTVCHSSCTSPPPPPPPISGIEAKEEVDCIRAS